MDKLTKQEIEALLNLALSKDPDNWLLFKSYPIEARKQAFSMLKSTKLETLQMRDDGFYEFYLGLGLTFFISWVNEPLEHSYYCTMALLNDDIFTIENYFEFGKNHSVWLKNIYRAIKENYLCTT